MRLARAQAGVPVAEVSAVRGEATTVDGVVPLVVVVAAAVGVVGRSANALLVRHLPQHLQKHLLPRLCLLRRQQL
jgi:hypothetical protein